MNSPYQHLTDDDLVAVGNAYSKDLSFYVAGWDYSNVNEHAAESRCRRRARPISDELKARGLRTTCSTLCPLGAPA